MLSFLLSQSDHEYICKEEVLEEPLDIIYLNESQEVSEDVINEILEKESGSVKLNSSNLKRHLGIKYIFSI